MRRYSIRAIVVALFLIFTLGLSAQSQQVLMTIGNHQISADNFVYLFLKNDTKKVDKHDIEKYLTLFKNFKLKVIEAQSCGAGAALRWQLRLKPQENTRASPVFLSGIAAGGACDTAQAKAGCPPLRYGLGAIFFIPGCLITAKPERTMKPALKT